MGLICFGCFGVCIDYFMWMLVLIVWFGGFVYCYVSFDLLRYWFVFIWFGGWLICRGVFVCGLV